MSPEEQTHVAAIERFMGRTVPRVMLPDFDYKMRPAGATILEDDVEVQASSCIDRPTVGESRIGRGVKIDNLVQVGHSSTVGENTLLCAQVGLAGKTLAGVLDRRGQPIRSGYPRAAGRTYRCDR